MSNIVVEEYTSLADAGSDQPQIPGALIAKHNITGSGTTAKNATALNSLTNYVIISSDADEAFKVGSSAVTAATTDRPLYAKTYREVEVKESDTHVAFINK